jgi:hypothetical protein
MAAKLKSITKQIPWYLLLKAALLGLVRFFGAPYDFGPGAFLFAAVALLLYFVPLFRPKATAVPFAAVLALGLLLPGGATSAIAVFLLAALLFGLKDLDIVDRTTAYELFVILVLFAAALGFFRAVPHWGAAKGIAGMAGIAFLAFLLGRRIPWEDNETRSSRPHVPALLSSLLLFELGMALLFAPIDFLSQACILFAFGVFAVNFMERAHTRGFGGRFLLHAFGIFVLVAGFALTLTSWKI